MTDYGQDLHFGTFLTPVAAHAHRVVDLAVLTEQVGLDLVTVQDHPYQARSPTPGRCWPIAGAHLAVRLSTNVATCRCDRRTCSPRPRRPSTCSAAGGSSSVWAPGGSGTRSRRSADRRRRREALDALVEAIAVIRGAWDTAQRPSGWPASTTPAGAHPGPAPAHDIEIWLGAFKPRMLALTGRLADGWLPSAGYAAPETLHD